MRSKAFCACEADSAVPSLEERPVSRFTLFGESVLASVKACWFAPLPDRVTPERQQLMLDELLDSVRARSDSR